MEAIVSATKTASYAIGMEDEIGTIEKGKLADIIIVNGDPLQNISILCEENKIEVVMKDGKIVKTR
jgi:imidazolonepropionase-like amidohydrolase